MSEWNSEKYLRFKVQRTQPSKDLAAKLSAFSPGKIVDIGCGPGNSTAVLKEVFPKAVITGIDSSENMIAAARKQHGDIPFEVRPAQELEGKYDLIFSNACLQWIPDHEKLIPFLMEKLNAGGHLAVQMPMNQEEPLFKLISRMTRDPKWNFENADIETSGILEPGEYFDILSDCSSSFDLWETVYYHVLPSHEALIDWVETTKLRPYLAFLGDGEKALFKGELLQKAKSVYPFTKSGDVVLKFRRLFFTARR